MKQILQIDNQYVLGHHQSSRLSSSSSRGPLDDMGTVPLALLARNRRPLYSRDNERSLAVSSKPWHDPDFLSDARSPEKEEWLAAMLQSSGHADIQAFELVLNSISTWKHGSAPKRAEHWMSRLRASLPTAVDEQEGSLFVTKELNTIDMDTDSFAFIKGYLRCYLYTIQAWANAPGEDPNISVNRAEAWLNKAKAITPTVKSKEIQSILTECHNAFLDICSKGTTSKTKRNSSEIHAAKAEATLREMVRQYKILMDESPVRPNTESVNFVMRAINHCRKDTNIATRCRGLLDEMEKSDETKLVIRPNPKSYNLWLKALATVARTKAINCARTKRTSGVSLDDGTKEMKELQQAVDHMKDLFQRGRLGVIEDNIPYNILLSAWAGIAGVQGRHEAPMQVEKIFWTMIDLKEHHRFHEAAPDAVSYLQVIRTWAASGSERAGERASWWIDQQWSDFEKDDDEALMPTTHTYTTAINAWGKVGEPNTAEELLLRSLEKYKELKAPQLEPNTELYAATIKAWLNTAGSNAKGQQVKVEALQRAVEWLESLVRGENDSGPATRHDIFLSVLNVSRRCAKLSPAVLDLASRVFSHLRNSSHFVQPVAYTHLLQVGLSALSGPEHDLTRTKFLTELVTVCCEDGFLGRSFVLSLTNGPIQRDGWTAHESARLSAVLFPDWPISPSWTRNVQKESDLPSAEDFQRTRFKFGDQKY